MSKFIVLASASPRRIELLRSIGLDFQVDPAHGFEEVKALKNANVEDLVLKNAIGKAEEVAKRHKNSIIIGVDTVGAYQNHILEKPKDEEDAFQMLKKISGRSHEVLSGICLLDTDSGKKITHLEKTKVNFHEISDEDLRKYVKTGESIGKSASYAAQGIASLFIKGFEGDFLNVVGLSMQSLNLMFKEFDINLLDRIELSKH